MHVWHTNAEYPTEIRKSSAPIPNTQGPPPTKLSVEFEGIDVVHSPPVAVPSKRKKRNDSVSPLFSAYILPNPEPHHFFP